MRQGGNPFWKVARRIFWGLGGFFSENRRKLVVDIVAAKKIVFFLVKPMDKGGGAKIEIIDYCRARGSRAHFSDLSKR